ncbi:MAG: peptidylprolyl isomerase, partial [Melioribacteraceae bacterium]
SDIVETRFGYHLIKLLDKQKYGSYEDEKKDVRTLYDKTRKVKDKATLIERLSNEKGFVLYEEAVENAIAKDTANTVINKYYLESEFRNVAGDISLFEINKIKYTLNTLIEHNIKTEKNIGKKISKKLVNGLITTFKDEKLIEQKAAEVLKNNSDFISLMNEYKNGIYIFKLQEDEVWNKMNLDSSRIKTLYEQTKDNYTFPNKAEFMEIFSRKDSLINLYYSQLQSGEDFGSLAKKKTERVKYKTKAGNQGMVEIKKNDLAKHAFNLDVIGDYSKPFKYSNGWSIVKLMNKVVARTKTFTEARAEVTSKFQDMESSRLEKEYKTKLEKTYSPKIFYDELKNAYKAK